MRTQGITIILLLWISLPLSAQLLESDCGETIIDYQNGSFKINCLPSLIEAPGAVNKAKWGEYLWEFGDGHYSTDEQPSHGYAQTASYQAKAYLLPYYANNLAYRTKEFTIRGKGPATNERYSVIQNNKNVGIYTNARNRLVPGSEVRVVVHYRIPDALPPGTPGYILFFYNKERESGLKYSPFQSAYDETNHYGENALTAPTTVLGANIPSSTKTYLQSQLGQYDVKAIRVPALRVGQSRERRLFLSLKSYAKLRSYVPKDIDQIENDRIQLSLKAVFVPESATYAFNQDFDTDQYNLTLAKVHDPNKIKVEPRIGFYKKGDPERLKYTVQFQNKGSGAVNRIDIKLPWTDAKNLDVGKLEILGWSPRTDNMRICPSSFDPLQDRYPCLQVDSTSFADPSLADTLVVSLHNISVGSREEEGVRRKDTKGEISFSVVSNNERSNRSDLRALIVFEGANPVPTRKAKTRWWQKTMGIRLGYNLMPDLDGYEWASDDITDALSGGVYFKRTPLIKGLGYGVALDYNRFRFQKNLQESISDLQSLAYSENLRYDLLELKGSISYQVGGLVRFYGSAGISTPLSGKVVATATYTDDSINDDGPLYTDTSEASFGWINKNESELLFNEPMPNKTFFGFLGAVGIEAGKLNEFSVGAEVTKRHFPSFFNEVCAGQFGINTYLRINLSTKK